MPISAWLIVGLGYKSKAGKSNSMVNSWNPQGGVLKKSFQHYILSIKPAPVRCDSEATEMCEKFLFSPLITFSKLKYKGGFTRYMHSVSAITFILSSAVSWGQSQSIGLSRYRIIGTTFKAIVRLNLKRHFQLLHHISCIDTFVTKLSSVRSHPVRVALNSPPNPQKL